MQEEGGKLDADMGEIQPSRSRVEAEQSRLAAAVEKARLRLDGHRAEVAQREPHAGQLVRYPAPGRLLNGRGWNTCYDTVSQNDSFLTG